MGKLLLGVGMACWICERRRKLVSALGASVGTCINCYVHACDPHSDRLTKSEFWCFVCLQKLTLDAAGVPYAEGEEPPEAGVAEAQGRALTILSGDDVQRLLARVASDLGGAEVLIDRVADDIAAAAEDGLDERQRELVRLASGLAITSVRAGAGGMLATAPQWVADPQLVDPRLRRSLGL